MKIRLIIVLTILIFNINKVIAKELTIVTSAEYPPFEMINEKGEIVGFDIDIIKIICKKMQVKYKIIHQPFNSIIIGLQTGKFDLAISGLAINEKRKKQVDFTDVYFEDKMAFIYSKYSKIKINKTELKNKIVGVQSGTVFEKYLQNNYKNVIKIKPYISILEALIDLENKRIDACIGDKSVISYWKVNKNKSDYEITIIENDEFKFQLGIAVKKGNIQLLNKINKEIKQLKRTNSLKLIETKYFGQQKIKLKYFLIQIAKSGLITIKIAIISLILGIIFSLLFWLLLISNKYVNIIVSIFTSLIRAIPEFVIIIYFYFGMPLLIKNIFHLKFELSPIISTSIGLAIIFAAFSSRILYQFYEKFPEGQVQAALSLNISKYKVFLRIKMPQILRDIFPILNNLWLVLLKDTSLVALVGLQEIMGKSFLISNATGKHFYFYVYAAFLYLCLTIFFNNAIILLRRYARRKSI